MSHFVSDLSAQSASMAAPLAPPVKREFLEVGTSAFCLQSLETLSVESVFGSPGYPSSPEIFSPSPSANDSGSDVPDHSHKQKKSPLVSTRSKANRLTGKIPIPKRKRCRVTPEQLSQLEALFAVDPSPTAVRRREISKLLGTEERQMQIWFQNRRAKAKMKYRKEKRPATGVDRLDPPDTPPQLSTSIQPDIYNLLHEEESVTIIPCTELMIGTWRRVASTVTRRDLIAYVCNGRRCFTWFVHSLGSGFKMEIPFDTVLETEFTKLTHATARVTFSLSHPPLFYIESPQSPDSPSPHCQWQLSEDWTEDSQATYTLRHQLVGPSPQLLHLLQNVHAQVTSTAPPGPPSYSLEQPMPLDHSAFSTKRHIESERTGPGYHHSPIVDSDQIPHWKNLSSSDISTIPSPGSSYSYDSDCPPPYSAPASIQTFSRPQNSPTAAAPASWSTDPMDPGTCSLDSPMIHYNYNDNGYSEAIQREKPSFFDMHHSHAVATNLYSNNHSLNLPQDHYDGPHTPLEYPRPRMEALRTTAHDETSATASWSATQYGVCTQDEQSISRATPFQSPSHDVNRSTTLVQDIQNVYYPLRRRPTV